MNFLDKNKTKIVYLLFACIGIIIFVLQHTNIQFNKGHHGWVSSHTLAIIKRANFKNGFLGYTCLSLNDNGNFHWEYFDRYPVLFSAFMNQLLKHSKSIASEVFWARSAMNAIFLLTMFFSYRFLYTITKSRIHSLTAVLFSFSGVYFIYYKDMVHYDQPALLAIAVMSYVIALVEQNKKVKGLYLIAFLIPLFGRGYSVVFLLILWFLISAIVNVKKHQFKMKSLIFKNKAFQCLVISILSSASFLAYNIHSEARIRKVSYEETSIVKSAKHRLGLEVGATKEHEEIKFKDFSTEQVKRFLFNITPYSLFPISNTGTVKEARYKVLIFVFLLVIVGGVLYVVFIKKERNIIKNNKVIFWVACLSGGFWLFVMKNLSAYHDYTTFYYLLASLILFSVFLKMFKRIGKRILFLVSLLFFITSLSKVNKIREEENSRSVVKHKEIEMIKRKLEEGETIFFRTNHHEYINGVHFGMCYYFNEYVLTNKGDSKVTKIISKDKNLKFKLLTSENSSVFLYQK